MIIVLVAGGTAFSSQRDRFVFTQLKYDGEWDPYPAEFRDILSFLSVATSIKSLPDRRVVTADDKLLFSSPFVIMLNNGPIRPFSDSQRENLRQFINRGGTLFIEDSSAQQGYFDGFIRQELAKILPGSRMYKLKQDNVIYKAFYLLRRVAGRKIASNWLEGVDVGGRTAVIYSQNDIFGAWARDNFGNYFLKCVPGGEAQRFECQKLTVNLLMFSLTGTYKNDTIHQPFIRKKLELE